MSACRRDPKHMDPKDVVHDLCKEFRTAGERKVDADDLSKQYVPMIPATVVWVMLVITVMVQ